MNKKLLSVACGAVIAVGVVTATTAGAHTRSAKAKLATADGTKVGTVDFRTAHGHTEVRVRLAAVPGVDAFHGFHIHANDVVNETNGEGCIADSAAAPATWFASADGHYNPTGQSHSRHVGDLPVVYVNADGSIETHFRIDKINPGDLDGRAVIVHGGTDNFANIPVGGAATQYTANSPDAIAATSRTGNAGDRIACGVITER